MGNDERRQGTRECLYGVKNAVRGEGGDKKKYDEPQRDEAFLEGMLHEVVAERY